MAAQLQNPEFKDVVLTIPATIYCKNCLKRIDRGTKLNCRKEKLPGEYIAGEQLFKFLFNCIHCLGEIAIKSPAESDLENTFLAVVAGAKPVYEVSLFRKMTGEYKKYRRMDRDAYSLPAWKDPNLLDKRAREVMAEMMARRAKKEQRERKLEEIGDALNALDVEGEMDVPDALDDIKFRE